MAGKFFSRQEAESKIGRYVRIATEWRGIKAGTTGMIVQADYGGSMFLLNGEVVREYDLAIEWPDGSSDWISRAEYEEFLVEE
jgi:hypothetical protein